MKSKLTVTDKHFKNKIIKLQQQINKLEQSNSQYLHNNHNLKEENNKLQEENQQLKEQNERLLEYTELSKEDIKFACKKDKELAKACGMITGLGKSGILGGIFK